MAKALLRSALLLVLLSLAGCSGGGTGGTAGGGAEEQTALRLAADLDDLAASYSGVDTSAVIEVPFGEPLDASGTQAARAAQETAGDLPPAPSGWIRLYREEPLEAVPGTAYLGRDGTRLVFVPAQTLEPGVRYLVVLSSDITGVSGGTLGDDLSFPVATAADGVAVRVSSDGDAALEGEPVRFSASCAAGAARVEWRFDAASADSDTAEGSEVEHAYPESGAYRVEARVTDPYGRAFTGEAAITVLPDPEKALTANPVVQEVEVLSSDDLGEGTLADVLRASGGDVLSVARAWIAPPGTAQRAGVPREEPAAAPVVQVEVRPDRLPELRARYIEQAAADGRFLGIVRFMGVPTVLAGGCTDDGTCTLDLFMDEGELRIKGVVGDREIEIDEPALRPTPAAYALSLVVTPETLDNLRSLLPDRITEPLCRLSLGPDNALHLAVPREAGGRRAERGAALGFGDFTDTVVGVATAVGSAVGGAVGAAVDAGTELAETIWDFLTGDDIDLLGAFADLASTLTDLNPAARAAALRDALSDVYDAFQELAAAFADDPQGVISAYTDPAAVVEDLQRFVDGNGENDLASLFRRAVDKINGTVDSLGTNPFEALAGPLEEAGGSISELLEGLSAGQDVHLVLTVGSSTYLDIQQGSTSRTFPLGEIDAWPLDDFLEKLPSFPLSDVITALSDLAGSVVTGLQVEIGFYYDANDQRFTVRYRVLEGSDELYRFEAFASAFEGAGIQIRVTNPLLPDTGITVTGSLPGLSGSPLPPGDAGDLLEAVYPQSSTFPELQVDVQARFRDLLARVHATTRPDISFGIGLSVGFELNYHVAVGGKVGGSIGISASMGAGDALDSLTDTLKGVFDAARQNLGLPVSIEDGVPVVSFPDEDQLMAFLDDVLGRLKTEAPEFFDNLEVAVSASGELGVGVGAGGTGTGGAGADLVAKLGVQISASAADMYDIADFCIQHGSSLLFAGITDQVARYQASGGDLGAIFDVDAIPKLFEDGLEKLADEVDPDELDAFMNTLSTGLSVTLSVSLGPDAEAEEAVSGEIGMDTGVSVSANGELILNSVLDALRIACQLQGLDDTAAYDRLKTLDQPGVFPEISFSALPVEAKLTAALDEGIKVEVETAAQATWLSGSVSLEGDPYRITGGAVSGPATVSGLPAVVIVPSAAEPQVGQEVTFAAHAGAREGTAITGYEWKVDEAPAGTGESLTWTFGASGLHVVTVTATESDGRSATRTLRVTVPNRPPPAPVLNLASGEALSPDGSIPFTPVTDPDGDPVTYEVEVVSVPGNVVMDSGYYTVDEERHLIALNGLPYGDYQVRMRAVGAGDPGPWTDPVTISLVPGAPTLVSPDNWVIVWHEDCVTLEWDTDQESSQVQIAPTADFADPVYSEWFEGTDLEVCPSAMPEGGSLDAGWYYWRVRVAPLTGTPSPWSEVRAFRVQTNHNPTAPQLVQPPASAYDTRDPITFAFEATDPDGDPLTYTIELSQPQMTLTSTTGVFEIAPGTFPPGQVVFRSIEVSDGNGGVTGLSFAPWGFEVRNSPPDAPRPFSPGDGAEISADTVTLQVRPPQDFDGDPIEGYEFHVMREGADAWEVHTSSGPSLTLTRLARGRYLWKTRALAASGTREGDFSEEFVFVILRNHLPTAAGTAPAPGAVFSAGQPVTLAAEASDLDGDAPAGYGFETAVDERFRHSVQRVDRTGQSTARLEPLEPGVYFWHVRAFDGYSGEPGPWSEAACFSVIDRVPAPGVEVEAAVFEPDDAGRVVLRFDVKPAVADCLGRPVGETAFQIGTDPQFSRVLAEGPFEGEIVLELKPGLYYVRAGQAVAGLRSPWSEPVRFGVQGPPEAADDAYATAEDAALTVDAPGVLANDIDPNADPLRAELVEGPAHGLVALGPDGSFTYTPDPDFNGADAFTYRASDGTAASDPATVQITVEPVNDPPVARDDGVRTDEDTPVTIDVLANDTDPDGDPIAVLRVTQPDHGTVTLGGGTVTYTPDPGYSGKDAFSYVVTDPHRGQATGRVDVEVTAVNDAPVIAVPGPQTVAEGDVIQMAVTVTDPEGDPFEVRWENLPEFCRADPQRGGSYVVECGPEGWQAGTYAITLTAADEDGARSEAGFTLTVTPVSWPPVARDDAYDTDEDQELSVAAPGVLANDYDMDGDALAVEPVSGPAHGELTLDPDGSFRYTPAPDYNGTDQFTYRVLAGGEPSGPATVTITVRPVNDPPTPSDDVATTPEDTPVDIDVLANDTDPDGDALTVSAAGPAAHGAVEVTGGAVRYTPEPDFNGTDVFPYTVTDGTAEAAATVSVTVSPVGDPPVLAPIGDQTVAEGQVLRVDLSAADPDGDALAFGAEGLPAFCSLEDHGDGTAALRCAPGQGDAGEYSITVRVTDDGSPPEEDQEVLLITVENANWPPTARDDAYTVDEDGVLIVEAPGILGNDGDPDGDPIEAELVRDGRIGHGRLVLYRDGGFRYTPEPDFHGTDQFTYRATDGELASGEATVRITVRPVNDPPVLAEVADQTVQEGATLDVSLSATDVDGDALSFAAEAPGFCSLTDNGDGTAVLTCSPGPGDAGGYTVNVSVADDGDPSLTDEAAFGLTVTATANHPPQPADDAYTVEEDGVLEVDAPGVLGNDSDPDGDPITAEAVAGPAHGELTLNPDGAFQYAPAADFNGTDTFTYRVHDGDLWSESAATVTITVTPVNDAPVLAPVGDQTVAEGDTLVVELSATDVDGDDLTFSGIDLPGFCAVANLGGGTGSLTCSPGVGDAGPYTFTIRVTDDGVPSLSDQEIIELTVTAAGTDVVTNGDFEAGMPPWVQYTPPIGGTLTLEVVTADGSKRLHYVRTGSGGVGGEINVYQAFEALNTAPYSEIYLECDVKLVSHTLTNSGTWSYDNGGYGEWPGDIRIEFVDTTGETYDWNNGFADFEDFYERTNYTQIPLGVWYHYRSPNLKNVTTTKTGPHNAPIPSGTPAQISKVKVGGSGWDFEGYFDNVKLILIE